MRLRFTRHARNKMRQHNLTEQAIAEHIELSDEITPGILGRTNYVSPHPEGRLHITAIDEGSERIVVTVILKR